MPLSEDWQRKVEASGNLEYVPGSVGRIVFRHEGVHHSCPACRYDVELRRWAIFPSICPGVRARDADCCRGCPIV